MVVLSKPITVVLDEATAASLLWQLKAIATKEVENLPVSCIDSFFLRHPSTSEESSDTDSTSSWDARGRSVSVESVDAILSNTITPILSFTPSKTNALVDTHHFLLDSTDDEDGVDDSNIDHHDWSERGSTLPLTKTMYNNNNNTKLNSHVMKQCKRKRESFVGLTTSSGTVRCTLRKKFSWKQYPELEDYLLQNQDEYFEFSSRNYTADQRMYNNTLTRGLLELAADEGYAFEDFTFSMVRDRIRCYYKSHSQSSKKKRRR